MKMSFSTFCNICFIKENIIKLSEEEPILNILISFTSCPELVNDNIYLCTNCSKKLEEYDKFRELYLTNFVRFRYLYNEHKKQLEIRNEPDIETQLKAFVDINVERPKDAPLIENLKDTQTFRNNTASHIHTTCWELDHEFIKISLDELLNKNSLSHVDTSCSPENSTLKNETQNDETDSFNEDPEKYHGSSNIENNTEIYIKCEPLLFEEGYNELTNTDTVATSISCFSSTSNENYNLPIDQNSSQVENTYLEKDGPNPESHDQFVSDTDNDSSDSWTNTENYTSDDTTAEGSTDSENKTTTSDSGDKNYKCDKCNKIFTDTAKLKKHKHLHNDKRPYKCDECDLGFTRRDHLTRHKRIHSGETPFSCNECNKTFRDACNLMRHKRIHDAERPYKCDKCGIGFTERFILNRHKRKYHGEKPYSCDECNQKFTNSSTLKNHKRTHNGDRPHKCDECGSAFKRLCHLKAHLRIHTGERPYNCDECGKKFIDNSKLINHKRIHSGEKPFKCDECGVRFTERSSLNKHKRVHTGQRPYSCTECKKTFSNSSNLRKHMRLHSDE